LAFFVGFLVSSAFLRAQSTLQARFDPVTASFEGSKSGQARYLLRPVLPYAHLGEEADSLPAFLDSLLHDRIRVSFAALDRWMTAHDVQADEIGGDADTTLSRNQRGDTARYFVIHDTSAPYYGEDDFPADIDSADWKYSQMQSWAKSSAAHVFVGRTGASVSPHDFMVPWRATKLELRVLPDSLSRGLFLHIELVQPRRRDTLGPAGNDAIAPQPGFTQAQYRRLALLYIAAQVRRGDWLVPAFHAVLDEGIRGGHDDPQGFDLEAWVAELRGLIGEMVEGETDEMLERAD
jgi:hypothetical protein